VARHALPAAAVVNLVLAAIVLAGGTLAVVVHEVLGWVWVGFGVALTVLALLWVVLRRAEQ
jgi:hypothetical protein